MPLVQGYLTCDFYGCNESGSIEQRQLEKK